MVNPFWCSNIDMENNQLQTEVTFRFVVKEVSRLNKEVLSPPCSVQNLSWRIKVEPPKKDTKEKSIGVFLDCSSSSSCWACYAVAELRLLGRGTPFTQKIQHLFHSEEEGKDWGYRNFMPWTDVLNIRNGYIHNDSITLEVHVEKIVFKQFKNLNEDFLKARKLAIEGHKKLENDLREAKAQVEFQHKVIEDALKQLKKFEQRKESTENAEETRAPLDDFHASNKDEKRKGPTRDGEEARAALDKLVASNKDETRKESALEAELSQLTEDLFSSEQTQRAAKPIKLQDEITNDSNEASGILETEDRELNGFLLKCQNRELKAKLNELESNITNLEEHLEVEVKERLTEQKQSRKLNKQLKELEIQLENKRYQSDYYREQVEKMNAQAKGVKRQLEEAQEEMSREIAKNCKARLELEAVLES